ncbi:MAG: cytochrome c-type biogenesis protein CcmH [Gammaproteobacteria bacterium]|nr:cytochrome c-type biogenesis protein CcmH [Gammaproteobacteria bacterium]
MLVLVIATQMMPVVAQDATQLVEFSSPDQKALFNQLTNELRCLKCQNQTIADSQAGLAEDLRREIREQVLSGSNASQVKDYMVARYGDFILYRPRFSGRTLLLWMGPVLLLLIGLFIAWRITRRRQANANPVADSELEKARSFLDR